MSVLPLLSCIHGAAALCQGLNVVETESPQTCGDAGESSISNEIFLLIEGPD